MRPIEAAGLVLIRRPAGASSAAAEVLLGRRRQRSRFMPGVYVFPGGRLSAIDRRPSGFAEHLRPAPAGLDDGTRRRLAIFARAALRETFEETELLLGVPQATLARPGPVRGRTSGVWAAFARDRMVPDFGALKIIARAITPTGSPIRFHTRFFLADGANVRGSLGGDGELEDNRWVPVAAAASVPMPEVTALVLAEALAHRAAGAKHARSAALFRWTGPHMRPCHRCATEGLRA